MRENDKKIIAWLNRQIDAVKDRALVINDENYTNCGMNDVQIYEIESYLNIVDLLRITYTIKKFDDDLQHVGFATTNYKGVNICAVARAEDDWRLLVENCKTKKKDSDQRAQFQITKKIISKLGGKNN